MLIRLEARGFRNLEPVDELFAAGTHLVLGGNGAGKTSLLEAIYLVATTKSFRTTRIADCCRHDGTLFELGGETDAGRRVRLEIRWEGGQRQRSVNGRQTSLAEHLSVLPVVAWTAGAAEILTGPPAERRRFLDRGMLGLRPTTLEILSRYRRALEEKRRLLQRGGETPGDGQLDVWNRILAEAAAELIERRAAYTESLREAFASVLRDAELPFPAIEIRYRPSPRSGLDGIETVADELAAAKERERLLGQPILGPHRDDLEIRWQGHRLRRVASAGERKALGLLLLAAHGRALAAAERRPVYLLDDADTELDRERLTALWRVFSSVGQLFATSNRPQVWEDLEIGHQWHCAAGRLEGR